MPQIRCPSCGTSINLEMRKKTDLNLIVNALQKKPKTFTELLKITRLPRKTLSLRLKSLINSGVIVKDQGYHLNGASPSNKWDGKLKRHLNLGRKNILLLLLVLTIAAQAYAMHMSSPPALPPSPPEPTITDVFTARIVIHGVTDLYLWQIGVTFDPNVLVVTNAIEGGFLDVEPEFFMWSVDSYLGEGSLLVCASLHGDVPGSSGSGTLAIVEFGVIGEGSRELQLKNELRFENTGYYKPVLLLLDSAGKEISDASVTIET